jgi:hypothetical protein
MRIGRVHRDQVLLQLGAVVQATQGERDRPSVRGGGPAGGQHRRRPAIRVQIDQRLHDFACDDIDAGRGPQRGVQDALLGAEMNGQHAAFDRLFRRRRCRKSGTQRDCCQRRAGERGTAGDHEACVHDGMSPGRNGQGRGDG